MDKLQLGRKLKEARLARKMTQSEVVGDFITRNMLSQIESGVAAPSIKTLEYLCDVLKLPLDTLLAANDQPHPAECEGCGNYMCLFLEAKSCYLTENYEKAISLLNNSADRLHPFEDESFALLSKCYLLLSEQQLAKGIPAEAILSAKLSCEYAKKGIYAREDIDAAALVLIHRATEKLRKELNDQ